VNLVPDVLLGQGSCGKVIQGCVRNEPVAVKSLQLKTWPEVEILRSFLDEIQVMNSIENHDFIVRLIGASTEKIKFGTVYLFMEYCALGSLESFLRSSRDDFKDLLSKGELDCFVKEIDGESQEIMLTMETTFSSKHLISWSYHITKGMEYLETRNVTYIKIFGLIDITGHLCKILTISQFQIIHGDLAARNILLASRDNAKICDFGLANKMIGYRSTENKV
jgi:serine/threonine protein kinase